MVVIDGMSLRMTAEQLGVSEMTVQRRVKRGLNNIAMGLLDDQAEYDATRGIGFGLHRNGSGRGDSLFRALPLAPGSAHDFRPVGHPSPMEDRVQGFKAPRFSIQPFARASLRATPRR